MEKRTGNAECGTGIRFFLFLRAQKISNCRIDTDAEADTHGSDQILNREDQRERSHRIFIDLCHEITVDNVVQRVHHHREHHGKCHG